MAKKKLPNRFKDFTPDECNVISEALLGYPTILDDDDFYEEDEKAEMLKLADKLTSEMGL